MLTDNPPAFASLQRPLRTVDSITELDTSPGATDAGCIAISGSHGGSSSARYALAARPWLTVFNDAGVGLNDAGIAALQQQLQQAGLAACTVAHTAAPGLGRRKAHYKPALSAMPMHWPRRWVCKLGSAA